MQHLLEHNLLSLEQFGFRPSSSTQEAILTATRSRHKTLEERGSVACIFFDLSKAFDSLPYSLIMYSLARVGVCGELYRWLAGYLTGRKQRVVLDGDFSQTLCYVRGSSRLKIYIPTIGLIYRTFRQAEPKCLLCLYKLLVPPILEYCCGV